MSNPVSLARARAEKNGRDCNKSKSEPQNLYRTRERAVCSQLDYGPAGPRGRAECYIAARAFPLLLFSFLLPLSARVRIYRRRKDEKEEERERARGRERESAVIVPRCRCNNPRRSCSAVRARALICTRERRFTCTRDLLSPPLSLSHCRNLSVPLLPSCPLQYWQPYVGKNHAEVLYTLVISFCTLLHNAVHSLTRYIKILLEEVLKYLLFFLSI